jgi:hypothetical protein
MAEDLTGFSPLDALGPEFGGINRPNINEVSLKPFEGDRIVEPRINFPVPSFTNPNINVRKQVVTRPSGQKLDIKNQRQAITDYVKSINQANQSRNQYAKIYSYDAGPDGNAFYKRYMAYGQETFDKIGFSPLRDNEANFNAYTSNWQGAKAMMSQSFMPMLAKGFISAPRDMMKMLSGDFSGTNINDAREYEELAAVGYSSKGGLTGFMNNSAMNFGYSAGIMLEALAEEAVFLGLEVASGATATPLVAAGTANNVSKIFKGIKGLNFAADFGKTMKNSLKTLSNFGDAKKYWQSVRASEKLGSLGNFLNPAENLLGAFKDIKKLNAVDNLTSLAAISKTAGGFYRDVRNINMATSEARLEAGMVENKVYDKLYNQHYDQFGEPPGNSEQKKMVQKSKEASIDTFYKNAGLIYMSNKLTFGNITSPRGGIRNFIKTTKDDIVSIGGGKFGNVGKIVYNNAKKQFAFEANNVKNLAKSWYTDFGFKTAAKTVGFFKANVAEGLQENAQEIISRANERYYTESYRSPLMKSHNFTNGVTNYAAKSKSDYYLEELDNEFSMQGLQTFASGFMMGLYGAPLNNAIPFASKNFNRIFRPEMYQEYVNNKTKIAEGLVKSLNDVNIGEFLKSRFLNTGSQDIINEIRQSGTKKQAIDAELESLVTSSELMLETNTTDVFLEKLESLRQMDDKEFANTIGASETDDLNKYRQRIDITAKKLTKIQDRYKYYNEKYPNPVDSNMLEDMDEKSDKYKDLVSLQNAWKVSVKNAVFFNEAFEDTIVRMTQISDKITTTSGLKKVSAKDFQNILRPETIVGELNLLKNEINALSGIENKTDQDKTSIRAKKEKYKELENFVQAYAKFNSFFNREEYNENIKAELEDELGREPTDEEVAKVYNEAIGAIDNEDARTEVIDELKVAFNGYLKSAASQNDEIAFDENLDRAFELLMDHYKLGQESKKMAKYANVLHDPGNFFDLVQRNKQWMRDLYERRSEYYEEIVKQEMQGVEDNALLNALASRGIYVSLDDFSKWKYDGTPPTEFFDNVNKKVIPQQTDEYNEIYELFQRAAALKEKDIDITNEIVSDQLKLDLERLEKEKEQRLESLEEVPVKTGVKSIKKARFKSMSYSYILEQMETESYADLEIKNKDGEEEKVTVFKDADGNLKLTDKDGDLINLKDKAKIKKAEQYKIEVKKDPRAVKQINREFTIRRNDLIRSSRVKNKDSFYKNEEELPTQDTPYTDMNEVLQEMLFREFSKIVFSDPVANKRLIDSDKEFDDALLKFVKEDPKAKEIIDSYNKPYQTEETLPDERAELIRPKTVEEVESALEVLYTKNLVVNPEDSNTYIEVDEQGMRIPGTPTHARISTLKGEYEATSKAPANRGTIIDDMLRDFVEGTITSVDDMNKVYENHFLRNATEDFSQDFINDLFNIFTEVKAAVDKKGIKLISRIPTLWGVINGKRYAGTIDLMGIDERGNVYVIDLKTSTQNRRDEEGDYYTNFKEGDTIQQSGYAEMIRQRTGITVKNVVIFPVQTTVIKELNQYVKAEANKDENGKFTMQVEIDRNIFPESPEQTVAKKTFAPAATADTQAEIQAKKADIERRRQGLNGVEEIIFNNPNFRLEGFEIDGNYWNVVTSTDRAKVLVNINGVIVPFYLTTGQAGKGLVPGWYPFFGIGKDGWLNKTDKSDMETYYERYWGKETADIVKSVSDELNSFYGTDPATFKNDGDPNATSRPLTTLADKVEDYINSKLSYTPAINNADARKTLRSNVEQLGKEINAKYDAELAALEQPATPTIDIQAKEDIEAKIEAFNKTIESEYEDGDYIKLLSLAEKQVKDGTIPQTPENIQLLTNYPKLFEELIKATDARNKTLAEYDKEKVLVGNPNELPIYGIESSVNPATGRLDIKWVEVGREAITNIGLMKINNYAANELFNYGNKLQEELKALEQSAPTAPVSTDAKADIEKEEEKAISPKLSEVLGKTVYYNGKPYVVEKEGVRFILNSDTSIIELAGDENSTLESLGIDYFMGEFYKPQYDVTINNENSATVNGVQYTIKSDNKGNIIGLSPLNKPEQVIKNEKLLIAVEIERNKTNFINTNEELEDVNTEELLDEIEETDPASHQKLMNVERVYNINWNETVEAGLSNLYSKKPLTESQKLAVDLWVTDGIVNITKIYSKTSDPIYANALDNLEIINTLLYEGYAQEPKKTGIDESAKRTIKQTNTEAKRKSGKTITEEVAPSEPKASPDVERRKQLGDKIIGTVWERLAKEGITNADNLIGTRATIDNKDFDKFWSNVTVEDLQNYKASLEAQRDSALAKINEIGERTFDPQTGELTSSVSEIEDYYNPTIEALNAEINFMENKTPERVSEFSQGDRLIAKNDVFYKDKVGNNSIFAESQSTIVVTKVDEKTGKVTVTPLGNSNSMEYTLKEMNSNFEKESTVIQKTQEPQEEIVITDDDKQIIKESTDSIDTFLGEFAAQAEIEKSVDDPKVTLEKLDKDLLDDLKC